MTSKCPCLQCFQNIEFESSGLEDGIGLAKCPHCGNETTLFIQDEAQQRLAQPANTPPKLSEVKSEIETVNRRLSELAQQKKASIALPDVERSSFAVVLLICAALNFTGAVLGVFAVVIGHGEDSELGFAIFGGGVFGGFVLTAFACIIEDTHSSAQRLERLEIILKEIAKNTNKS